jgi:hypothetical protein
MNRGLTLLAAGLALIWAAPALATQETEAPTTAARSTELPDAGAIEPERLELARSLANTMLPPEHTGRFVEEMVEQQMELVTSAYTDNDDFKRMTRQAPRIARRLDQFIVEVSRVTTRIITENMPSLVEATAQAYARRFTIAELRDLQSFFATPTGQRFATENLMIATDPAMTAWQTRVMATTQEEMMPLLEPFMADVMREAAKITPESDQ